MNYKYSTISGHIILPFTDTFHLADTYFRLDVMWIENTDSGEKTAEKVGILWWLETPIILHFLVE